VLLRGDWTSVRQGQMVDLPCSFSKRNDRPNLAAGQLIFVEAVAISRISAVQGDLPGIYSRLIKVARHTGYFATLRILMLTPSRLPSLVE
jgi:hypothetical protein